MDKRTFTSILDTYAAHSTLNSMKPTLGSVNGDVVCSRFSSSATTLTPSSCTWIISFRSPLRKSTQFCKSTTVVAVALTHYMKLYTVRTISCCVKTYICFIEIYFTANDNITNTKLVQNREVFFCRIQGVAKKY